MPMPLFYLTQSATSSTIAAKVVLARRGNTLLFWSPIDSGNVPVDGSIADAANRFSMGVAVRIE